MIYHILNNIRKFPSLSARVAIKIYQHSFSLFLGRSCRYAPTCSHYTEEAIRRYGLWRGGWMGLARILRCRPGGASGFDPVPDRLPPDAKWYLPWRYGQWTGAHIDPATRID
ncbi:membrane protein insertion efficiency factor YidD [Stappia sp. F7233]|uniref:Putative membrane protein insertion efficiency factor n=1 Tax=Stappia albiluteola TaxID=2758565 RepID=A0A839AFP9_9HYPH|nr:membrane protein insertion efficiency factor YidD [Stappia albiluteola]MBA5777607.1 membrane protein insertion efficiency factor YidD [Stappia albiluteola]